MTLCSTAGALTGGRLAIVAREELVRAIYTKAAHAVGLWIGMYQFNQTSPAPGDNYVWRDTRSNRTWPLVLNAGTGGWAAGSPVCNAIP